MLIKGIRSFDPENKNVITFFKPLTLIVGPNGAGKTVSAPIQSNLFPLASAVCACTDFFLVFFCLVSVLPADDHRVPEALLHRRAAPELPLRPHLRARPQGEAHTRLQCSSSPWARGWVVGVLLHFGNNGVINLVSKVYWGHPVHGGLIPVGSKRGWCFYDLHLGGVEGSRMPMEVQCAVLLCHGMGLKWMMVIVDWSCFGCRHNFLPGVLLHYLFLWGVQVAGETETKGQIKLRFKTAAGKDVVCIRSFQLTQKASKMEFKAIESVLQTINPHTGEVLRLIVSPFASKLLCMGPCLWDLFIWLYWGVGMFG